jgi:hypothetical protein
MYFFNQVITILHTPKEKFSLDESRKQFNGPYSEIHIYAPDD